MKKIKAIDLFSGCGGVSIGLTRAGFKVACAVEIDDDAVRAYKNYHLLKNVNVIQNDICNLSGEELLKAGNIFKNEMYLLAGCPPCQKFSMQNRVNNSDESKIDEVKKLLMEYKRIIKEIYPPFILMENVPGIISSFDGRIINEFLSELRNTDAPSNERYQVVYGVVNAADYGVPQLRKRVVLHAVRFDIYETIKINGLDIVLPETTHSKNGREGKRRWVTVRETFKGLPAISAGERYNDDTIKNHYCANLSSKNLERMRIIRANGGTRTALPENLVLNCHKTYKGHADVYGIMNPDAPAPTITGGCLSYSKGRFGHPFEDRAISVREAARLQTFPDDYEFGESLTKAALEIGNAVPIKLVEASGKVLLRLIKSMLLKVGMKAPEFSLADQNGNMVSLSDFLGKKVVLYFYPKDNTPGCTRQACAFALKNSEIESKNAVVIGISKDSVNSHLNFANKYELPFILLSDTELSVIQKYGVWQEKKLYGKVSMGVVRTTFLIDEQGNIQAIMPKVKPDTYADEIIKLLGE